MCRTSAAVLWCMMLHGSKALVNVPFPSSRLSSLETRLAELNATTAILAAQTSSLMAKLDAPKGPAEPLPPKDGVLTVTTKSGVSFDAFTEVLNDETWVLVLAYKHAANDNEELKPGSLPLSPTEGYSHEYIKTNLQVETSDVSAVRFYCHTDLHSRKVHFKSTNAQVIARVIEKGNGGNSGSDLNSGVTKFSDHSAKIPPAGNGRNLNMLQWGNHPNEWDIRYGDDWECDSNSNDASQATLHQVWVKLA